MIVRVLALSRDAMLDRLSGKPDLNRDCYMSILDAPDRERVLPRNSDHCLTVFFEDITSREFVVAPPEALVHKRLFTRATARRIIAFLKLAAGRSAPETLYVHCSGGISRSGAIAKFVERICYLDPAKVERDNPRIEPNDVVLVMLSQCWLDAQLAPLKQARKRKAVASVPETATPPVP
jgi:predicted protein tyrosine phosphatase